MTDDTCMVSYEIYPIQKKYYFWRFLLFRKKEIDQGYYCHKVGSQIETWMLNVILPLSKYLPIDIWILFNGFDNCLGLLIVLYGEISWLHIDDQLHIYCIFIAFCHEFSYFLINNYFAWFIIHIISIINFWN